MAEVMKKMRSRVSRPRGLRNLGNTCFFNSVVQAISSCPPIISYLDKSSTEFTHDLSTCIKDIRESSTEEAYNADYLLSHFEEYNPDFEGHHQQDAQEFYQAVVKIISEENKETISLKPNILDLKNSKSPLFIKSVERKLAISKHFPPSASLNRIDNKNPLEGVMASNTMCTECKTLKPTILSPFIDISLTLPGADSSEMFMKCNQNQSINIKGRRTFASNKLSSDLKEIKKGKKFQSTSGVSLSSSSRMNGSINNISSSSTKGDIRLEDCLTAYFQETSLDDVECPTCTARSVSSRLKSKTNTGMRSTSSSLERDKSLLQRALHYSYYEGKRDSISALLDTIDEELPIPLPSNQLSYDESDSMTRKLNENVLHNSKQDIELIIDQLSMSKVSNSMTSNSQDVQPAATSSLNEGFSTTLTSSILDLHNRSASTSHESMFKSTDQRSNASSSSLVNRNWTVRNSLLNWNSSSLLRDDASEVSTSSISSSLSYLVPRDRTTQKRWQRIAQLPAVLCLHIGRRVYDYATHQMKKLNQWVGFPVELNMDRYLQYPTSSMGLSTNPLSMYDLCSVISHHGSESSGHYTAYCKLSDGHWMHFSDEVVRSVSFDEVARAEAYMLFYTRKICT